MSCGWRRADTDPGTDDVSVASQIWASAEEHATPHAAWCRPQAGNTHPTHLWHLHRQHSSVCALEVDYAGGATLPPQVLGRRHLVAAQGLVSGGGDNDAAAPARVAPMSAAAGRGHWLTDKDMHLRKKSAVCAQLVSGGPVTARQSRPRLWMINLLDGGPAEVPVSDGNEKCTTGALSPWSKRWRDSWQYWQCLSVSAPASAPGAYELSRRSGQLGQQCV